MKTRLKDNPTKPELAILKHLWRNKRMSAREVHGEITEEFNWTYSTVRTVLDRMTEKGIVSKTNQNGANIYKAEVSKILVLGRMISDFSNRVLELDKTPTAAFFADSKLLSEKELEELEEMLDKHKD